MPKYNPKRKGQREKRVVKSTPATPPNKKDGGYSRRSPKQTKIIGIIIIAALAVGFIFLFKDLFAPTTSGVEQWDHVQLRIVIWNMTGIDEWKITQKVASDTTKWYNFTTIYAPATDTNATIDVVDGLPTRIFDEVKGRSVGSKTTPFLIKNCIDTTPKDGYDDYETSRLAEGWGFPSTHPFYNTTIVVTVEVLALNKRVL